MGLDGRIVLLVQAGTLSRRDPLITLRAAGMRLICVDECKVSWAADLIESWILTDVSDHVQAAADTVAFMKETDTSFDAIFCYDEFAVHLTAVLAEHVGLPWIPVATILQVRDKFCFREACHAHGIAAPRVLRLTIDWDRFKGFVGQQDDSPRGPCCEENELPCSRCVVLRHAFEVESDGDSGKSSPARPSNPLHDFLLKIRQDLDEADIAFPVVIKPTHGAGKLFVRRVDGHLDLLEHMYNFVRFNVDYQRRFHLAHDEAEGIFVEELIEGIEVDVDCLVQKGRVIFASINENRPALEPYFLELGGRVPPRLSAQQQKTLVALTQSVVGMYGTSVTGIVHFEAMIEGVVAKPIELNLRLGGAETYRLVRAAYEVDLVLEALRMQLGQVLSPSRFPATADYVRCAASINLVPTWHETRALLATQEVDPALTADPAYVAHQLVRVPGTVLVLPPESAQYLGWILAAGSTPEEAEEGLARLAAMVKYTLAPVDQN
eukprot:m.18463 g.18463  ORF g.18463 m.18463 type:complete len:493 (-) comp3343_c0_seq1:225-1703(-)